MRTQLILTGLISIILVAGCRTEPLGGEGGGGNGGTGGGGDSCGGGFCPIDGGPVWYQPDLGYTSDMSPPSSDMLPWSSDMPPGPGPKPTPPPPPSLLPCGRTTPDPGASNAFAHIVWAMAAHWRGTVTTPWSAPYTVEVDFDNDGSYHAYTLDWSSVGYDIPPFYYDRDPEHDNYNLVNLNSDGTASGNLYLEFESAPDAIENLRIDSTLTHLKFDFYNLGYGPVSFDLACTGS